MVKVWPEDLPHGLSVKKLEWFARVLGVRSDANRVLVLYLHDDAMPTDGRRFLVLRDGEEFPAGVDAARSIYLGSVTIELPYGLGPEVRHVFYWQKGV